MNKKISILVVEDSEIFAEGLSLILRSNEGIKNVHHVKTLNETLDYLHLNEVDIVILDLDFETKEYDGFIISEKIKQQFSEVKVMILSQHTRVVHYNKLFNDYSVDAYLDKQLGSAETLFAIDEVINGRKYIDRNIRAMLEIEDWMKVSKRETDVIALLATGLTQKEIAEKLFISPKTVEVHIRNMTTKFDVKNSTELIAKYAKYRTANRDDIDDSFSNFKEI